MVHGYRAASLTHSTGRPPPPCRGPSPPPPAHLACPFSPSRQAKHEKAVALVSDVVEQLVDLAVHCGVKRAGDGRALLPSEWQVRAEQQG